MVGAEDLMIMWSRVEAFGFRHRALALRQAAFSHSRLAVVNDLVVRG